ncbi:MAG: hypothetical protein AMJ53_04200 [Gammaproteobacteria bacterium SG8_11]|nr:MAG: hypothetical protein AMJ53_04200 [Gammaproteobacteria bacterium SG8_11]
MNVAEQSLAYLVHAAPGRCRFKIPSKRGDAEYFHILRETLLDTPGVEQVQVNPLTASALIFYDTEQVDVDDLTAKLQSATQCELSDRPMDTQTVWEKAVAGVDTFDQHLKEITSGQFDFKSLLFIVLVIMAIRQLQQGAVFGAASTLLWYALQVLMKDKNK